jgi:hypothetical protein
MAEELGFDSWHKKEIFFFSTASNHTLEPVLLPIYEHRELFARG